MKSIIAFTGIIIFFINYFSFPTSVNGRFVDQGITGSKYNILLQINTNTGTDDIGGATIVFGFDTNAVTLNNAPIKNVDYIFHNFDGGQYSAATITKPMKNRIWVNIDLPFTNNNNGTVVAGSPGWADVVTIKFDIVDINRPLGLSWFITSFFWGIYDADNLTLWETGMFEGNFGLEVEVKNGWNLVSVPGINSDGQGVNIWWPGKNSESNVYRLMGNIYEPVITTTPGEGYWMKHLGDNIYNTGDEWPASGIQRVSNDPINVSQGWNIIGGYEKLVQASQISTTPPGLISGPIYSYSNQYQIATTIEPGRGYLVKLNGPGQINFTSGLIKENGQEEDYFKNDWGKIIFTDDSKGNYSLYLVNEEIDLNLYELPPVPPKNGYDIRFASGRIAENINDGVQSIMMSGIDYPIRVRVENMSITLQDDLDQKIHAKLESGDEIIITNESINKLLVQFSNSVTLNEFSLSQNYPNPFNPSTKIKFAIPQESNVELNIYNVLGELVVTLVNKHLNSGYHEYEFNASNLSSGIYIYRIKAGNFVETKKMLLLK